MVKRKLYDEAKQAIEQHKWIKSEQAGRDIGADAEREWTQVYWLKFCRQRFVRHVRGETYFEEFGPECYDLATGRLAVWRDLVERILDRVRDGAENLHLLWWAVEQRLPRDHVLEILQALDLNNHRLPLPATPTSHLSRSDPKPKGPERP